MEEQGPSQGNPDSVEVSAEDENKIEQSSDLENANTVPITSSLQNDQEMAAVSPAVSPDQDNNIISPAEILALNPIVESKSNPSICSEVPSSLFASTIEDAREIGNSGSFFGNRRKSGIFRPKKSSPVNVTVNHAPLTVEERVCGWDRWESVTESKLNLPQTEPNITDAAEEDDSYVTAQDLDDFLDSDQEQENPLAQHIHFVQDKQFAYDADPTKESGNPKDIEVLMYGRLVRSISDTKISSEEDVPIQESGRTPSSAFTIKGNKKYFVTESTYFRETNARSRKLNQLLKHNNDQPFQDWDGGDNISLLGEEDDGSKFRPNWYTNEKLKPLRRSDSLHNFLDMTYEDEEEVVSQLKYEPGEPCSLTAEVIAHMKRQEVEMARQDLLLNGISPDNADEDHISILSDVTSLSAHQLSQRKSSVTSFFSRVGRFITCRRVPGTD